MEKVNLEGLHESICSLSDNVKSVEMLVLQVLQVISQQAAKPVSRWLDVEGLVKYHPDKPSKSTIYGWVCAKKIPYNKTGKKLRFNVDEINAWLSAGNRKSNDDLQIEAAKYKIGGTL